MIGPDPRDPRCWIYTDFEGSFDEFEKSQAACRSGYKWFEFRKNKWQPIWLTRVMVTSDDEGKS